MYIIYIYLYCTVCNHSWNCKPKYDKFSSVPSSTCSPLNSQTKSSKIPLAHRSQSSKPPMSRTDLSCESAKKKPEVAEAAEATFSEASDNPSDLSTLHFFWSWTLNTSSCPKPELPKTFSALEVHETLFWGHCCVFLFVHVQRFWY